MQVAFHTAEELKQAIDDLFQAFPIALYYNLDSIAPFLDYQCHNGVEMYYVFQGTGTYFIEDAFHPLQKGTLVIIKPNTIHKVMQHSADLTIGRHVLIWQSYLMKQLYFDQDLLPLQHWVNDCLVIHADESEQRKIEELYDRIQEELTHQDEGCLGMCISLIQQLLVMAIRLHKLKKKGVPHLQENNLPHEIRFLVQYISSNFQDPLSLSQLAKLVYMNPSYLTTLFKQYTGFPIAHYIQQRRVHHAQKLLTETDLRIGDIAIQCGFNQTSQFIKIFRKVTKVTPAVYRKTVEYRHQ